MADSDEEGEQTLEDYEPKAVLLTGGAGFIGSNVMRKLLEEYPNLKLVCLDCLSYCASPNNFKELLCKPNFQFVKGDITNSDLVNYLMEENKIDTIMHFAAETHVDNSFGNSFNFTKTNVLGTHVLLESAKRFKNNVKRFIHVSTDEVYGESTNDSERNTVSSALNPTNPYAATKAAAELMVRSYCYSFNVPIIITRGNNVYGPHQYPEKLIPKFIYLLDQGKPCPLHGDGSNKRSYLHVDDVANAFSVILKRGKIGEVYNIGSKYEFSNADVLDRLLDAFEIQNKTIYITYVTDRAFNDFRYHIDTFALEELGWNQKINFADGMKATKEWYLKHRAWWGDIAGALKAHPFAQAAHFNVPQKRNTIAGREALKRKKTEDSGSDSESSCITYTKISTTGPPTHA